MRLVLIMTTMFIASCAHGKTGLDERLVECDLAQGAPWPTEKIPDKESLTGLYKEIVPNEVRNIFKVTAEQVEKKSSGSNIYLIADIFHEKQIQAVEKSCTLDGSRIRDLDAAAYVERISSDLATISGLRASSHSYPEFVTRASGVSNLTSKMTFIVLSASCSATKTPKVSANLSSIGLKCIRP